MTTTLPSSQGVSANGANSSKKIRIMSPTELKTRIEKATPEQLLIPDVWINKDLATMLLEWNTSNRPAPKRQVDRLAWAMESNNWIFNGGSISLNVDMVITDGQKRLKAIEQSDSVQKFHIQTGLEPEAFATIDTGKARSGADAAALRGYTQPTQIASAVRAVIYYDEYLRTSSKTRGGGDQGGHDTVTVKQIDDWMNNKAGMVRMLKALSAGWTYIGTHHSKFLSHSTWTWLWYIFNRKDPADGEFFMNALSSGDKLDSGTKKTSAIFYLRRRLLELSSDKNTRNYEDKIRYVLTAWNYYREGVIISSLKIDKREADLPKII